ncbi:MAG: hypothetical protein WB902_26285 [Acetobacteraceae bacterium]
MEIYFARASWMWSLSLIVVTISIHATGVVMMALGMVRIRSACQSRSHAAHIATLPAAA